LLTAVDYSEVFKKNIRVSDNYWTILAARGRGEHSRLGLAVAKKRAKRAVDRNRLKRIVREHFRHHCDSLERLDLVVMNRDQATEASNEVLQKSLEKLWGRLIFKCKS